MGLTMDQMIASRVSALIYRLVADLRVKSAVVGDMRCPEEEFSVLRRQQIGLRARGWTRPHRTFV